MVRLFVSVVCSVWGPLPCPDSEQAGLELVRGLCDIWTGGGYFARGGTPTEVR